MAQQITRILEIDAGHRLLNHEGKCKHAHGHRYKFEVTCEAAELDSVGRVIDFSSVKQIVGGWLDHAWDHGFILQVGDPLIEAFNKDESKLYLVNVPPTAENLSLLLLEEANARLQGYGVRVVKVRCWETPNCYADAVLEEE